MTGEVLTPEILKAQDDLLLFIEAFANLDVNHASDDQFTELIQQNDGAGFNAIVKLIEAAGTDVEDSSYEDVVLTTEIQGFKFRAGLRYYSSDQEDKDQKKVAEVSLVAESPQKKFLWINTPRKAFRIHIVDPEKPYRTDGGYVIVGEKRRYFSLSSAFAREMYESYSGEDGVGHIPTVAQRIDMEAFRNNLVDLSITLLIATGRKVEIVYKHTEVTDDVTDSNTSKKIALIAGGIDDSTQDGIAPVEQPTNEPFRLFRGDHLRLVTDDVSKKRQD